MRAIAGSYSARQAVAKAVASTPAGRPEPRAQTGAAPVDAGAEDVEEEGVDHCDAHSQRLQDIGLYSPRPERDFFHSIARCCQSALPPVFAKCLKSSGQGHIDPISAPRVRASLSEVPSVDRRKVRLTSYATSARPSVSSQITSMGRSRDTLRANSAPFVFGQR